MGVQCEQEGAEHIDPGGSGVEYQHKGDQSNLNCLGSGLLGKWSNQIR